MHRIRSLLLASSLVVCGSTKAQSPSAAANSRTTHIELIVAPPLADDIEFPPSPTLHASDFQLQRNGKRIPFQLTSSSHSYPRHLLVVTSAPLACEEFPENEIRKMLDKGWSVQLTDSNANATATLSKHPDLRSACATARPSTISDSLQSLEEQPGRRVILFTTAPDARWLRAAAKIPEIYAVDGGVPVVAEAHLLTIPQPSPMAPLQTTEPGYTLPCKDVGGVTSPNDPCNITLKTRYRKAGRQAGIDHQTSIPDAIKAIDKGADNYYDLSFQLAGPGGPVHLRVGGPIRKGTTLDMYSLGEDSETTTPSRVDLKDDLVVTR